MKDHFVHSRVPAVLAVLCLAVAGSAGAVSLPKKKEPPLTPAAYQAAKVQVDAQYKADQKLCGGVKGPLRDVCEAEAQGKADATRADLEARYKPSADAEQKAKEITADANFKVAKAKCALQKGDAKGKCVDLAKAAREAAIRQAKVEKIEETGGPFHNGAAKRDLKLPS